MEILSVEIRDESFYTIFPGLIITNIMVTIYKSKMAVRNGLINLDLRPLLTFIHILYIITGISTTDNFIPLKIHAGGDAGSSSYSIR